MLLESKRGNWKYLPKKWTQIPKYDEDKPTAICIETSDDQVFGNIENENEVKLQKKDKNCQKWTRSKAVDGYFALETDNDAKFLTVGDNLSLTIVSKSQISD